MLFILLTLYFTALTVQFAYGVFFLRALRKTADKPGRNTVWPGVSVVICARNEAGNLAAHLPAVLEQDYPGDWEVRVVNDGSTDGTAETLAVLKKTYPRLIVAENTVEDRAALPGKKSALDIGIRSARYAWLLLTDADCLPASGYWLEKMISRAVTEKKTMILGYGGYSARPGRLNRFVRWETRHTAMLYFSFARAGKAYMGVGRNLLFKKALYSEAMNDPEFRKAYARVPSGDDDLLINDVRARKQPIGCCIDPAAATVSIPPSDFRQWVRQKRRHVSTGKLYPWRIKGGLGLYALSHAVCWLGWLTLTVCLFTHCPDQAPWFRLWAWLACILGLLRILLYNFLQHLWALRLENNPGRSLTIAEDLLWMGYNVFFSPYIFFRNRKQWK